MRTTIMLAATLVAAAPLLAQTNPPPPSPVQRVVPNPETERVVRASQQQATQGATTAHALLRQADQYLVARRMSAARDAIERAETRALTRTVLASQSGKPASDPVLAETASARAAIAERNVNQARSHIAAAIRLIEAGVEPATSGTPAVAPQSRQETVPPLPPTVRRIN